ncbi:MAG: hypothetical protein EOP53_24235 [Sphingobacteriales bacterium]|nr:MAG: hypothetical protein EOP53_24235 [Sphingobacteriales bacterium]
MFLFFQIRLPVNFSGKLISIVVLPDELRHISMPISPDGEGIFIPIAIIIKLVDGHVSLLCALSAVLADG